MAENQADDQDMKEDDGESEESSGGKEEKPPKHWADEIDALLRLFFREGRTPVGLLLLEAAWVGLLILVAELFKRAAPDKTPAAIHLFPNWPAQPIPITDLWFPGALFLLIVWLIYSERVNYIWAVVRLVVQAIVYWEITRAFFACILLDAVWSLPLYALAKSLQRLFPNYSKKIVLRQEQSEAEKKTLTTWDKFQRLLFQPSSDEDFIEALHGASDLPVFLVRRLIQPMMSRARIGLARIADTSNEEARLSTKFSLQVWASAEQRVKSLLRDTEAADWISVYNLPSETRVRTQSRAALLAFLFGLDIVVWGSYTDPQPDGSRSVRINFYRHIRKRRDNSEKKSKPTDLSFSLFQRRQNFDIAAMQLSEGEFKELYWVLAVAVLGVLADRSDFERQPRFLLAFWKRADRLLYAGRPVIQTVLPEMAERFIAGYGTPVAESVRVALTPVFSGWAGGYFDRMNVPDENPAELKTARETLEKCVAELPNESLHLYRLGAFYAYLGEYDLAIRAFAQAKDARYNLVGPGSAYWAELDVRDIKTSYGDQRARAWARLTATTAEILHHARKDVQRDLLKIKDDNSLWEKDDRSFVSMRIVWELLANGASG